MILDNYNDGRIARDDNNIEIKSADDVMSFSFYYY